MKWLEDNPMGLILAGISGALLLMLLAIGLLWIMPASSRQTGEGTGGDPDALNIPLLVDSQSIETYAVVTERPLFNESRQPQIDQDLLNEDSLAAGEGSLDEEQVDAPDVQLTGVVITPTIRMVTLKRKDDDEPLVAFEGKPLEGPYGSWQVAKIDAREVVLMSGEGEELQLSLQVHDTKIEAPDDSSPKVRGEDEAKELQAAIEDEEPLTRAEEIRQRIAERREELKRVAEENGERQGTSYQDAIKSMVERNRKPQAKQEDD